MKGWPSKSFLEVCDFQGGTQPPKSTFVYEPTAGYLRLIQIRDFDSDENPTYVPHDGRLKKCIDSDVMIARYGASLGRILRGKSGAYNVALVKTLPDESVLTKDFLYHWLTSPFFQSYLVKVGNRAAQAGFNKEDFAQLQIPLPPLAEQERIVKLLDEADELRKLRAKADRRTATLIPALCHEMFGEPITNPKGWPSKRLGETTTVNPKLPKEKQPGPEAEVSFVPMAAVDETYGVISSSETRPYKEVAKGYTPFQNGDVLFAKITPCMQNGKSAIATNLIGGLGFGSTEFHVLRPTDIVTSEYIFWLIRRLSFRAQAEQNFTGTAGQQRVPTSFMENYPCPVPPLTLQKEFTSQVSEIRELEAEQAASCHRLDALSQSLLHRAFTVGM